MGQCEDTQAFFVLSEMVKDNSVDSIGYVSAITAENRVINNCRSEWLHVNCNTGEITVCGNAEYSITCVRYDYRQFFESEAVLLDSKKYGVYFETLVAAMKKKCLGKYREKRKILYGLSFFVLKLFGVLTIFCGEVSMKVTRELF